MMKHIKRVITGMLLVAMMAMAACGSASQTQKAAGSKSPSEVLVLKVGDEKIYLDEMNYYALSLLQGMGVTEKSALEQPYNGEYATYDEAFKAQLLVQTRQSKILYIKAVQEGITLTEEEEKEMQGLIKEFTEAYGADKLERYGITQTTLEKVYRELGMIRKLESKVLEDVEVSYDEQGTYNKLVFLKVELDEDNNVVVDENGEYTYLSEEEIEEAKANAEAAREALEAGASAEELIEEYGIEVTSGFSYGPSEQLEEVYGLKDGEISQVMEEDYGFEVVQLIHLKDEEYTNYAKEYASSSQSTAILEQQEKAWFDEFVIEEKDLVQSVWKKFTMVELVEE